MSFKLSTPVLSRVVDCPFCHRLSRSGRLEAFLFHANVHLTGFGRNISWKDDDIVPSGHQLTFKHALHIVSSEIVLKLAVPRWAFGITARLRAIPLAFAELEVGFSSHGP